MASPQDIIKAAASLLHQGNLKPLGFRKSGNTWVRNLEWPQVINIQLSQWNSSEEAQFTVNLGVAIEELRTAGEGIPPKGDLKEHDCDVRSRIGALLPNKQDKWWSVTPGTNTDELVAEIWSLLEQFGMPWLESLTTYSAVAEEFTRRKQPSMAALAHKLGGNDHEAELSMALAYASANPAAQPRLNRIARALSIPLPSST